MANAPNKLIALGFAAIGAGYVWELIKDDSRPVTPFGVGPDGLRQNLPYATLEGRNRFAGLADAPKYDDGKVLNVQDGVKTIKFYPAGSIDNRLKFIIDQMKKDARDPKTITEATTILSGKCPTAKGGLKWCVPVKGWRSEVAMLFYAVTNPNSPYALRYTRDPTNYDAFRSAALMRRIPAADCFVHGTLVLRDDHKMVPVETLRVGDRIWGYDKWTAVTQTWEKGVLPTWLIRLNNGSSMRLTPEHKVWVLGDDGERRVIRVRELTTETRLIRPALVDGSDLGRVSVDLRAAEIIKDELALPCFDFATEDQNIWLPEADWTVHNCDDMTIRLGAWLLAVGYSVKCRIVAPAGQPGQWAHIYLMVGTPPGENKQWLALDPTEADRGPFWEVPNRLISSKRDFNV